MNSNPFNSKTQVKNQQRKSWSIKLNYTLVQSKKLIHDINYEQPTVTLIKTYLKLMGGANSYIRFGCVPEKIFYLTLENYQDQLTMMQ